MSKEQGTEDAMIAVYREKIVQRINSIDCLDFIEFINNMLDAFNEKWGI